MPSYNILGISGSLRRHSFNRHALMAAAELMPATMQLSIASYDDIPLYNQDVEDRGLPAAVTRLATQIEVADGLLIASPEYNFSIAGVLKNAIDWMSRVPSKPFNGRPVAVMSATAGPVGGARHQYELRKILGGLDALVLTRPEVFINLCQTKFDAEGKLVDAATREVVTRQMAAFAQWIARLRGDAPTGPGAR